MAIADGLGYAHTASIIHRDIKPANVRDPGGRHGQGHGLRDRQVDADRVEPDADRHHARDIGLSRARADPGRGHRPPDGHLRAGGPGLRAADLPQAFPGRAPLDRPLQDPERDAGADRDPRAGRSAALWSRPSKARWRRCRPSATRPWRCSAGAAGGLSRALRRILRATGGAGPRRDGATVRPESDEMDTTLATPSSGVSSVAISPPSGALARVPVPADATPTSASMAAARAARPGARQLPRPRRRRGRGAGDGRRAEPETEVAAGESAGPAWWSLPRSRSHRRGRAGYLVLYPRAGAGSAEGRAAFRGGRSDAGAGIPGAASSARESPLRLRPRPLRLRPPPRRSSPPRAAAPAAPAKSRCSSAPCPWRRSPSTANRSARRSRRGR